MFRMIGALVRLNAGTSNPTQAGPNVASLPDDILRKILGDLPPDALVRAGGVCHAWQALANDRGLWAQHVAAWPPAAQAALAHPKAAYGRALRVEANIMAGRVAATHTLRESYFGCATSKAFGWSADGTKVGFVNHQQLRVQDASTGAELARVPLGEETLQMRWSPRGVRIAVEQPSCRTMLIVEPLQNSKPVRIYHGALNPQTCWSPCGALIAMSQEDGTVRAYDAATGAERVCVDHASTCCEVRWSSDSTQLLTTGRDDTARVTDVQTGHTIACIRLCADSADNACWSPGGTHIACISSAGDFAIVDLHGEARKLGAGGDPTQPMLLRWSPDGSKLAYRRCGNKYINRQVRIVHATDGAEIGQVFHDHDVGDMRWNASGSKLASYAMDAGSAGLTRPLIWVHLTDVQKDAEIARIAHYQPFICICWSPDGSKVAIAEDTYAPAGMRILDGCTGKPLAQLKGDRGLCYVSWSPDGSKVAYGSQIFDFAPTAP